MKEAERTVRFSVSLPRPLSLELDRVCTSQNSNRSELIREALRHFFETLKRALRTGESYFRRQVRERAYDLWERDGRLHGRHTDHWTRAEGELNRRSGTDRRTSAVRVRHEDLRTGIDRRLGAY
jgi:Arc/MetJ-type ribon-helix-helix transcriptional regulator